MGVFVLLVDKVIHIGVKLKVSLPNLAALSVPEPSYLGIYNVRRMYTIQNFSMIFFVMVG